MTRRPRAVFRVDASPSVGLGHAMRCRTLAEALLGRGYEVAYASTAGTADLLTALRPHLLPLADAEAGDPAALARAAGGPADLLVIDSYRLDAAYEDACRPWARTILAIDDIPARPHRTDLLLDQTFGRSAEDYAGLLPPHCRLLAGAAYALLRPQFAARRQAALGRRQAGAPVRRLLVALSGTDPDNVTETVLGAVAASGVRAGVDVVLGNSAPHLERVGRAAATLPDCRLHVGVEDMAALMVEADLAIGAGGTASWERCALGLPTLMLVLADNQRDVAAKLAAAGAVELAGEDDLARSLARLAADGEARHAMSERAAAVCDGAGAARVAEILSMGEA